MMITDENKQEDPDDDGDQDHAQVIKQPDDSSLKFGKVVTENTSATQFGNGSEYRGTVDFYGAPSSDLPFSHILSNGTTKQLVQNPSVLPVEDEDNSDTRELLLSNQVEDDEPCPPHKDEDGVKLRRNCLLYVGAGAVIVFTIVIGIYFILCVFEKWNPKNNNNNNLPQNFTQRLTLREEWDALLPIGQIPLFSYNPVPFVVVSHTRTDPCSTQSVCRDRVLHIQFKALEIGYYDDILYNFLVGGDGYIYEGRGWKEVSAGTPPVDCSAISVGFIGDFRFKKPPKRQLEAFKLILDEGLRTNRLTKPFKMFMQREVIDTESPGDALIQILTSSPYWTPFTKKDILCKYSEFATRS